MWSGELEAWELIRHHLAHNVTLQIEFANTPTTWQSVGDFPVWPSGSHKTRLNPGNSQHVLSVVLSVLRDMKGAGIPKLVGGGDRCAEHLGTTSSCVYIGTRTHR